MKNKKWIQKSNLKKDRVKKYIERKYGNKAFTKDGNIKITYLNKAIKECNNKSLKRALILAKTLKKIKRRK